ACYIPTFNELSVLIGLFCLKNFRLTYRNLSKQLCISAQPGKTGQKILSRCDLCLIQEVRDAKGEAIPTLVKDLNSFDKSHAYTYVETIKYYTVVKDFVLVGQHTCPKTAMKEIDELYTVFNGICKKWKTENVVILGDLNAACSYITIKGFRAVRLRSDPKFRWLIGDEQDTTVRQKTHCAYDRIVIHGREMISGIVPDSAKPFNFKEEFHLTEDEALEVSDHFPVEVDLKPIHRYLLCTCVRIMLFSFLICLTCQVYRLSWQRRNVH
uniref:Deoxyribonuclease I-like 1-like n=1 Tax=Hucho hucho TaxID=62062 RepID=A0A4W5P4T3_9TELE